MTLNKDLGVVEIQEPNERLVIGAAFKVGDLFNLIFREFARVLSVYDIPIRRSK
jgi:hypothetical protein